MCTSESPRTTAADSTPTLRRTRYLWWPPQKIAGKYLSAQLSGRTPHELGPPPEHGVEVEVSLGADWHREPMGLDPYSPGTS